MSLVQPTQFIKEDRLRLREGDGFGVTRQSKVWASARRLRPSPAVSTPLDLPWACSPWPQGSLWSMSPKLMHSCLLFSLLLSWSCIITRIQYVAHCKPGSLRKKKKNPLHKRCYELNAGVPTPKNSYVEILPLGVMLLGCGAFGG